MLLFFGFLTGLALVAPVGPVALTLFGLGAERGRRVAVAGAGGVVLADAVTVPVVLVGAGVIGGLNAGVVRGIEVVMAVALLAIAVAKVLDAERARQALAGMRHPTRTLAGMTLLNPLSLVAWLGLSLALPEPIQAPMPMVLFGIGLVLASAVWHTGLAVTSGTFGTRLGDGARRTLTRGSGVLMMGIAAVLVF